MLYCRFWGHFALWQLQDLERPCGGKANFGSPIPSSCILIDSSWNSLTLATMPPPLTHPALVHIVFFFFWPRTPLVISLESSTSGSFKLVFVRITDFISTFHGQWTHSYLGLYRPDHNVVCLFNLVFDSLINFCSTFVHPKAHSYLGFYGADHNGICLIQLIFGRCYRF